MKIRLVRAHGVYRRGSVLDMDDGPANELLRRGIAVIEPQQELLETAAVEVQTRKADATPRRKRSQ